MGRTGVFIYGSQVSRDTFEHLEPEFFELTASVTGQSAISAYSRAVELLEPPSIASRAKQRVVSSDFSSSLRQTIPAVSEETDLVVIDLVDERHGVYILPDGSVITRSTELIESGVEMHLPRGTKHIAFGSDQHFQYWTSAITSVGEMFRHSIPKADLVVLNIPWAEVSETGAPTLVNGELAATDMNPMLAAYAETASSKLGAGLLTLSPSQVLSSPRHPQGDGPFNYGDMVYREVVRLLTGSTGRSRWDSQVDSIAVRHLGRSKSPSHDAVPARASAVKATSEHAPDVTADYEQRIRNGPNFLILGAQRSGSTWLEHQMAAHPDIFMAPASTSPILARRKQLESPKDRAAYVKAFERGMSKRWRGQRSILYFWSGQEADSFGGRRENVALNASRYLPEDTRYLVSLRDPVSRAISAYWTEVANGNVAPGTSIFQAAASRGIISLGFYRRHYETWANASLASRMTVLLYDDLIQDPRAHLQRALVSIGADMPDKIYTEKRLSGSSNRTPSARTMRAANPLSAAELEILVRLYNEDITFIEDVVERDLSHWKDVDHLLRINTKGNRPQ